MEFLPLIIFLAPIFVPLFMWYVLKRRESKVYTISRYARFVIAALALAAGAMNMMKSQNVFEGLGALAANVLIAYLLSKKWQKQSTELGSAEQGH